MKPLISILIPTRNRAKFLSSLISIVEDCPDERIEFLISDNSDQFGALPTSEGNVTYLRQEKVLNMTDHWNFLFQKASGKYITFVGDDDAFMPSALIELCNHLEKMDPDLVWTQSAGYGWPTPGSEGNFYQRRQKSTIRISLEQARSELLNLDSLDLPILYNRALLKRKIVSQFVLEHPGERFFSSRIPDINSGVKALFLSKTQYWYEELTFISGASPLSNGLLTRTNQKHPVALEFNDPIFNPVSLRVESQIKEVSPFGFVTYLEAIEESLLQLGQTLTSTSRSIAFKSVFKSSFPEQQLTISSKVWKKHTITLYFAFILSKVRKNKFALILASTANRVNMVLRTILRREEFVIIRGPGISDTHRLVNFLEANKSILSRKSFVKIYVP